MSTQFTSNNPTSYFGIQPTTPGQNWYRRRDPNSTDYKGYAIGDRWINLASASIWALTGNSAHIATWVPLGGGTTAVATLTPDAGAAVTPTAGNIDISGDSTQGVSTSNGGLSTLVVSVQDATTALKGVVNLATNAEAINGTDTTKAITSDDLKAKLGAQTLHGVLVGQGTTAAITALGAGTLGYPLLSGGAGGDPNYGQLDLTLGVTGVLPIANGGSNASSMTTASGIVKYDGTRLVTSTTATIDASNRQTNTAQPAFLAYQSANVPNVTGNGAVYQIICDTEVYDQGSNYNPTTGVFTAPVTGIYSFSCSWISSNGTGGNREFRSFVTTAGTFSRDFIVKQYTNTSDGTSGPICVQTKMAAGDTMVFKAYCFGEAGDTVGVFGDATGSWTWISGSLVC